MPGVQGKAVVAVPHSRNTDRVNISANFQFTILNFQYGLFVGAREFIDCDFGLRPEAFYNSKSVCLDV